MSIVGDYKLPVGKDEALFTVGYNRFVDDLHTVENEGETTADLRARQRRNGRHHRPGLVRHPRLHLNASDLVSVKVGVDGRIKTRDYDQVLLDEDLDQYAASAALFDIDERRVDPYVKATWNLLPAPLHRDRPPVRAHEPRNFRCHGATAYDGQLELGRAQPVGSPALRADRHDAVALLGRAHGAPAELRHADCRAIRSTSPSTTRPSLGNPNLKQETAWGIDAGFDQKIGDRGIFGFNVFNRKIKDKIDLVGTGEALPFTCDDGDEDCDVLTYANLGNARAWGIEVDLDMPLTAIGLPDTSIFANYTWLKSEVIDPVTGKERAFNDQPKYVYNIGFIQSIPIWNSSFGASYQKRGTSLAYEYDEITELSYQGNLEAFWETRLSKSTVLRFTGTNLLDSEKLENKINPMTATSTAMRKSVRSSARRAGACSS